jgi:putative endonuclease
MGYYIYIIYNKVHDKYYIGQTHSLGKRIAEHNLCLSKYTSKYDGGWEVIYSEGFQSRGDAMKREKFLKKQKSKDFYRKLANHKV